MSTITSGVGVVLIAVGLIGYFATDRVSWTALIPAILGVVLLVLGVLAARAESPRHFMHAAVGVAFLGAVGAMGRAVGSSDGGGAPVASGITWVACMVVVILGLRSFIDTRRQRAS